MRAKENTDENRALSTPIHTLLTREIRPIRDWYEWLAHWQWAEDSQWMESLLHCGFNILLENGRSFGDKEYDEIDRLTFYLTIADGWVDNYLLRLSTDGDKKYNVGWDSNGNIIRKTPRELRQQLAQKAFDLLCLNFFRKVELLEGGRRGDEFNKDWERMITSERLFPLIQNFFRVEKERFSDIGIRNLSLEDDRRSHNEQQAVNFLLNLAKFIWGWEEPEIPSYHPSKEEIDKRLAETRVRVDAAKPWMVEVLAFLGRLDVFESGYLNLIRRALPNSRRSLCAINS